MNSSLPALPEQWTPQQALAALQLLDRLSEALWDQYGSELGQLIAAAHDHDDTAQQRSLDFDDPCPF